MSNTITFPKREEKRQQKLHELPTPFGVVKVCVSNAIPLQYDSQYIEKQLLQNYQERLLPLNNTSSAQMDKSST